MEEVKREAERRNIELLICQPHGLSRCCGKNRKAPTPSIPTSLVVLIGKEPVYRPLAPGRPGSAMKAGRLGSWACADAACPTFRSTSCSPRDATRPEIVVAFEGAAAGLIVLSSEAMDALLPVDGTGIKRGTVSRQEKIRQKRTLIPTSSICFLAIAL